MDSWPVDSLAVPVKEAVAELRRIDTNSPGAADHGEPPLADFVYKSSPGLSGTTRPLEPILEQEDSSLRWPSGRFTRLPAPSAVRRALFEQEGRLGCVVPRWPVRGHVRRAGLHRACRRPDAKRVVIGSIKVEFCAKAAMVSHPG